MKSIRKIEKELIQAELKEASQIHLHREMYGYSDLSDKEISDIKFASEKDILKLQHKRQAILDRRSNWLSKLIWSIVAPLLVSVATFYCMSIYNLAPQAGVEASVPSNDLIVREIKREKNINSTAFEFLADIAYYEDEESFLLNTFMIYQDTFCPARNDLNNIYQVAQEKLNKIKDKYIDRLTESNVYEILKVKEATLESIEMTCSKYY